MKYCLIMVVFLALLATACTDSVGPTEPQSYTEKAYNNLVIFSATTRCTSHGINVNLLIENTINDYLYPVTDENNHCMYIVVYDQSDKAVLTYSYNYEAWRKLFGAYEINPGFKYAAVEEIPFYDLPSDIDYGKVQILFWLERKAYQGVETTDLSVRFDFNRH